MTKKNKGSMIATMAVVAMVGAVSLCSCGKDEPAKGQPPGQPVTAAPPPAHPLVGLWKGPSIPGPGGIHEVESVRVEAGKVIWMKTCSSADSQVDVQVEVPAEFDDKKITVKQRKSEATDLNSKAGRFLEICRVVSVMNSEYEINGAELVLTDTDSGTVTALKKVNP